MALHADRTLAAERDVAFEWCRRLGLPLMSPPRAPEAISVMGEEIEDLREALLRIRTATQINTDDSLRAFVLDLTDRVLGDGSSSP